MEDADFILLELKARCEELEEARRWLVANATKVGDFRQVDTYFATRRGRLKLRVEGDRGSLVYYERADISGPKKSQVSLMRVREPEKLRSMLAEALDVVAVVEKEREIYRWGRVQVHLDRVSGLGTFVEFERKIESSGDEEAARREFDTLREALFLREEDLISVSYCDLLGRHGRT